MRSFSLSSAARLNGWSTNDLLPERSGQRPMSGGVDLHVSAANDWMLSDCRRGETETTRQLMSARTDQGRLSHFQLRRNGSFWPDDLHRQDVALAGASVRAIAEALSATSFTIRPQMDSLIASPE